MRLRDLRLRVPLITNIGEDEDFLFPKRKIKSATVSGRPRARDIISGRRLSVNDAALRKLALWGPYRIREDTTERTTDAAGNDSNGGKDGGRRVSKVSFADPIEEVRGLKIEGRTH